ncbi:hypothetical protein ACFL5K_03140 [Gemmatimonadota bacterium]
MDKLIIVLVSVLSLSIASFSPGRASGPGMKGFPWPDPANKTVFEVPTVSSKIMIDGDLGDDGWKNAVLIKEFHRASDAGLSSIDAEVRVLFDGENLVFGFDLPAAKAADKLKRCFLSDEYNIIGSDPNFCISLDPSHEHGVFYQFAVDPAGRKQDLRVADESWSARWDAVVGESSGKWQAEVSIPVNSLLGAPQEGDIWGFNLALSGLSDGGTLSSTPIRLNLADAERFGHLLFKGDLSAEKLAEVKSSLPEVHRKAKEARLEANRKMCSPELVDLPGELTGLAPGKEAKLKSGMQITCLGLDNQKIIKSRYPFYYEKYENPELQRLRTLYRLDEVIAPGRNDFEKILLLNEWLVEHVPFGSPPPIRPQALHVLEHGLQGQTFFCTYLSFALSQMYVSLGWTARKLTSVGHGTLDVWSNYWRKWIQIDPSRNSYFRLSGTGVPLNSNEIRREFWRNGGVDMEMVFGTEQRVEKVTLETRDRDGLRRYRQDGYAWIAYKTRDNFFEVPFAYRNFLYLMIEDEYNRGIEWTHMYSGKQDERQLFSIQTDRVGDIFWTLNQAYIHLYDQGTKGLKVQLETVTPNFKTFEISIDNGEWLESEPLFSWELHSGQNFLKARSINKFGVPGPEHKIVLGVE